MKQIYFTKEEKKKARKKWNRVAYLKKIKLLEIAKRIIAEQEKKQSITL